MADIKNLKPEEIWRNFDALTQVPRPSGHLEKVQAFLLDFAKKAGVEAFQDPAGNIVMRKPATPGFETERELSCRPTWTWCHKRPRTASTTLRPTL